MFPSTAPGNPFSTAFLDQNQSQPESQPGNGDGSGEEILVRAPLTCSTRASTSGRQLFRVVGGFAATSRTDIHWEMAANIDRYD
jgi:hypothetical protein